MNDRFKGYALLTGMALMASVTLASPDSKTKPGDDGFVGPAPMQAAPNAPQAPATGETHGPAVHLKQDGAPRSDTATLAGPADERTRPTAAPPPVNAPPPVQAAPPPTTPPATQPALQPSATTPTLQPSTAPPIDRITATPPASPIAAPTAAPAAAQPPALQPTLQPAAMTASPSATRAIDTPASMDRPIERQALAPTVRPDAAHESAPLGRPAVTEPGKSAISVGGMGMTRTILSLAAVVSLILLVAGMVKKFASKNGGLAAAIGAGGKAPSGIISILGRYPLDRNTTLILMKVDRRILLLSQSRAAGKLGMGAASLTTLCEFDEQDDVASIIGKAEASQGGSISARFQKALETADDEIDTDTDTEEVTPRNKNSSAALAAVLQAALKNAKTKPAAAPPPARTIKEPPPKLEIRPAEPRLRTDPRATPSSDAAAELRKRLAGMRARAAMEVQLGKKREVAA